MVRRVTNGFGVAAAPGRAALPADPAFSGLLVGIGNDVLDALRGQLGALLPELRLQLVPDPQDVPHDLAGTVLAVIDCRRDRSSALDLLHRVRALPPVGRPAVLLLMRADSVDMGWAIDEGADDVLPVPFSSAELRLRLRLLRRLAERLREETRLGQALEQASGEVHRLRRLAYSDPLTGLPNRLYLEEWMGELSASRGGITAFAIHMIDLDGFKAINDRHGHRVGDRLLRLAAERICATSRRFDVVIRLGGDEIAAIQVGAASPDDAQAFADRLLAALRTPFEIDGHTIRISASIGCALYPVHDTDVPGLLHRADLAMYAAKALGRGAAAVLGVRRIRDAATRPGSGEGTFALFHDAMIPAARPEQELPILRNGSDQPPFNPAFDLKSGRFIGAWITRLPGEGGHGAPAEAARLRQQLEAVDLALRQAAVWRDGPARPVFGAVLPAKAFGDAAILDQLDALLRRSGADPGACEVVLDGTEALADPRHLHRLRELGFGLGVLFDGKGMVLQRLLRLPLTRLHLPAGFARTEGEEATILLQATVLFARSLHTTLLAHDVEDRDELERLRDAGVDAAAGTGLGGPLSWSALEALRDRLSGRTEALRDRLGGRTPG